MNKHKEKTTEEKFECKICGTPTDSFFNINFKKVAICEDCANSITTQQINALIKESINKRK